MKKIFEDYGIEIIERKGKYFLRYDAGELLCKYEELNVTPEDAEKAQLSEKDAYEVIIKYQNEKMFGSK